MKRELTDDEKQELERVSNAKNLTPKQRRRIKKRIRQGKW